MGKTLRVLEIFKSISGEVGLIPQGSPTIFLRLAGCNLKCPYCDTPQSQNLKGGIARKIDSILKSIEGLSCKNIVITGGEPLLQKNLQVLISELRMRAYIIQIETNGTISPDLHHVSSYVVDVKVGLLNIINKLYTPDYHANVIVHLHKDDWVKFVIEDESDFHSAVDIYTNWLNQSHFYNYNIAFTAINSENFGNKQLHDLIMLNNLDVVQNIQIHKIIGAQ